MWNLKCGGPGPDGIQDFHLKVSNISTGGTVSSLVLTANPGPSAQSWQIGTNQGLRTRFLSDLGQYS